ncbi:hypothetical protein ZWY2020_058014 [Hordeum vulgare]|nr:hypothetical protein ZWY2020_058014 [Hordeum vulgare]
MTASFSPVWALVVLLAAVGSVSLASASASVADAGFPPPLASAAPPPPSAVLPREVLRPAAVGADVPHRVSLGCAGAADIAIEQGPGTTLPSGIPSYTVDIINRCSGAGRRADCAISGIHVRCGWFSSVTLVEPTKFRRVAPDDCLVNDGKPLLADDTISFEYANSFAYKLSVAKASCVHPAADTSD